MSDESQPPEGSGPLSAPLPRELVEDAGKPPRSRQSEVPQDTSRQPDAATEIRTEATRRLWAAGLSAVIGLATIIITLVTASQSADALLKADTTKHDFRLAVAGLIVHGAVSIAAIYFGYQALRAAERLLIPRRLYSEAKDAEIIRALTGVETPGRAAMRQLRDLLGDFAKVTGHVIKPGGKD